MNRPRFFSVGAKLAGATIALVVMVTAGISWELSRYQRESLLRAKEASATAVTHLAADSSASAIVFEDPAGLRDELATLGRNQDIEFAAIWAVDDRGQVTRQLAELRRGHTEPMPRAPATFKLRRDPDRVVPIAPVRDLKGKLVGVMVVAFSLAPENHAIAKLGKTTLLTSTGIAAGLAILLMAMARLVVVGPLAKLVRAAKTLEDGRDVQIEIRTTDEVGQLAVALRSMAAAIRLREEVITARNRDMRLVLDNAGQGFITLDLSGAISEERSRVVDEWFGPAAGSPKFWDYLRRFDASLGEYFELGWAAVVDQILPLDLCLAQLPKLVHKDGHTYELAYQPILKGESLDKAIVVITEITVRLERERSEQRQRETMNIYRRLIADRPAFEEFFAEASSLVAAVVGANHAASLSIIKRQVHTLKGNCALFGIESVATLCHAIEDHLNEMTALSEEDQAQLRAVWTTTVQMRADLLDAGAEGRIGVARGDYDGLLAALRNHAGHEALIATVESWESEPVARRLTLVREQIESLAKRSGKAPVDVICQPTTLRLPPRKWGPFWSAFAHVVRNTVDHGLETSEERLAAGRPARATVKLDVTQEADHVLIRVEDDGPGIDWALIADRARARGLPWRTPQDLEAALFSDGISSREEATATSGRGIGLAAMASVMRELGGRIELTGGAVSGTVLRCHLPAAMLSSDRAVAAPERDTHRDDERPADAEGYPLIAPSVVPPPAPPITSGSTRVRSA